MKIEHDVPVPPSKKAPKEPESLRQTLRVLKPAKVIGDRLMGDSFLYHHAKSPASTAHTLGVKVIVRREGDQFRVWRRA